MFICTQCIKKWTKNKDESVDNIGISSILLGIMYREYKLILTANGLVIPETVDLASGQEIAYELVLDVEGIKKFNNNKIFISEEVKKEIVLGRSDKRVMDMFIRGYVWDTIMSMFRFNVDLSKESIISDIDKLTREIKQKETAINNLKKKNDKLSSKLQTKNNSKPSSVVQVKEVDTHKSLYEEAMCENFELEKKISNLQERLHYIE